MLTVESFSSSNCNSKQFVLTVLINSSLNCLQSVWFKLQFLKSLSGYQAYFIYTLWSSKLVFKIVTVRKKRTAGREWRVNPLQQTTQHGKHNKGTNTHARTTKNHNKNAPTTRAICERRVICRVCSSSGGFAATRQLGGARHFNMRTLTRTPH